MSEQAADRASEGRIQKFKGKVRSMWGDITDDDVDRAQGNRDQLIGTIKEKTGQAESDIRKALEDFDKDES
ncbi:MAG TPA: CsbD family protein [Dehalococcoidia bacterium]|jgi:uncharacterized protein YjbJ (UPF0337 family)|nr:CsbD family protein [Dehalococcoidia bacterium]